jgi:hypothetical protein
MTIIYFLKFLVSGPYESSLKLNDYAAKYLVQSEYSNIKFYEFDFCKQFCI